MYVCVCGSRTCAPPQQHAVGMHHQQACRYGVQVEVRALNHSTRAASVVPLPLQGAVLLGLPERLATAAHGSSRAAVVESAAVWDC